MVPPARDAHIDFVRLAAEEPTSLYFEEFLRHGFRAWPTQYCNRFPALATWTGIAGLKRSLRTAAGAPEDWRVLLAGSSLSLLRLGARSAFRVCRNLLSTDLSWPTYQHAVASRANRTANRVTPIAIRQRILRNNWSSADVAQHIADQFLINQCDGLFLPAVDHLGVQLPIRAIVDRINSMAELRFVLIDAAQAICHVSLAECIASADFIVAGSHKWMGAYTPTGIALYGRRRSRELIDWCRSCEARRGAADPVARFCDELSDELPFRTPETVNLLGLVSCAGAVAANPSTLSRFADTIAIGNQDVESLPMPDGEWRALRPSSEFRTRIVLLRATSRDLAAEDVRRAWVSCGCIVTGYDGGIARLSIAANGVSQL